MPSPQLHEMQLLSSFFSG